MAFARAGAARKTSLRADDWVAAVDRERPLLQGVAFLLVDRMARPEDRLDAILAHLWITGVEPAGVRDAALALLLTDQTPPGLIDAHRPGMTLVDGGSDTRPLLVRDLAHLEVVQRAIVVLTDYAALSEPEIGRITGLTAEHINRSGTAARAALRDRHPERQPAGALAAALHFVIPWEARVSRGAIADVTRGRELLRRRRALRAGLALATILAVVVIGAQLRAPVVDVSAPEPQPIPSWTSPPAVQPKTVSCDSRENKCQTEIRRLWQQDTVDVMRSYLNAGDKSRFVYSAAAEGPRPADYFDSGQGAMGIDLIVIGRGSVKLSLEIASNDGFAPTCGASTGTHCVPMRYLDGNLVTISESSTTEVGMEVQYSFDGTQVVSVVAQRVNDSPPMALDRATLIQLVQDSRLRLPSR